MQFSTGKKPPAGVVYDSDLGFGIDSVLALALLHGLAGKAEARIASLSVNVPSLQAAQLCDVIEKFYTGMLSGAAAIFFQPAAVGMAEKGKAPGESPIMTAVLSRKDDAGKPVFAPRIQKVNETAIAEVLIRNALTAQYDGNAIVILAGPATNLANLLALEGAKELITSKVKLLVVAGGTFGEQAKAGAADPRLAADLKSARQVLADWPTPIVWSGREVGSALPFPGASVETEFAYSKVHPVPDAYRAYRRMPYDAPARDMAAVLYAVRSKQKYFEVSEPGTVTIGEDGKTAFQISAGGKHRYLIADPAQKEAVQKAYVELACAKPVVRSFRRPLVADDEKKDDEKQQDKTEKP